jgi:hypothetical protein
MRRDHSICPEEEKEVGHKNQFSLRFEGGMSRTRNRIACHPTLMFDGFLLGICLFPLGLIAKEGRGTYVSLRLPVGV